MFEFTISCGVPLNTLVQWQCFVRFNFYYIVNYNSSKIITKTHSYFVNLKNLSKTSSFYQFIHVLFVRSTPLCFKIYVSGTHALHNIRNEKNFNNNTTILLALKFFNDCVTWYGIKFKIFHWINFLLLWSCCI